MAGRAFNQVGADLLKLAERSDLAYRPRELWKLDRDAVTRITIDADAPYTLERKDGKWKIAPLMPTWRARRSTISLATCRIYRPSVSKRPT